MIRFASAPDRRTQRPAGRTVTRRAIGVGILAVLAIILAILPLQWATLMLLALIAAGLMLIRPALALIGLALAIPFGGLVPLPVTGINVVDLLVGVSLGTWLAQGLAARRIIVRLPPLIWPLLVFIWFAGCSLTAAHSWREGVPELLKWVEFAAVYLIAAQVLTPGSRRWVIVALLTAGTIQAAIGAYQFFGQVGPEPFRVLGQFVRAYGTFRQPNPYAGYLGYLFPVALCLGLEAFGRWWRTREPMPFWLGLATMAVAGALAGGILMSWSRGAWMGLIAAVLVVIGLRDRQTAARAAVALALLILVIALFGVGWLPGPIESRVKDLGAYVGGPDPARTEITDANFSVLERLAHWRAGLAMFRDYPWLGVGIGNFAVRYAEYALPHWYVPLGHAHNAFINFLAETGILGAGAFTVFWMGIAWLTWRAASERCGVEAALAIGLLGTWAYLTVHSMFDNLFVQHMQLQLALLLGVLLPRAEKTGSFRQHIS